MAGQEVVLQDAQLVGIILAVSVRISGDYYHSEIRFAVHDAIAGQDDGFFAPGYLLFGEDVVASDLIEVLSLWGPCGSCAADVDGDGLVGFTDVVEIVTWWGPCP